MDDGTRGWLKLDSPVLREYFAEGRLSAGIEDVSDIGSSRLNSSYELRTIDGNQSPVPSSQFGHANDCSCEGDRGPQNPYSAEQCAD